MNYIQYSSLTGISIAVYFIDTVLVYSFLNSEEKSAHIYYALLFFMIMLGYIEGVIYGFASGNSLNRWIAGFGYAAQMYGTLGTTRFAIYGIIGLIYPLFYEKRMILKWGLFIGISTFVFMSVSMTAIATWIIFVFCYFFCCADNKNIFFRNVICVACGIGLIILFWNYISQINVIEPIVLRLNGVVEALLTGDYNAATTGRTELTESYYGIFSNSGVFSQIFGSGYLSLDENVIGHYSHNTYVDMLNYWGIFGCVIYVSFLISRIRAYRGTPEFHPMLLMKIVLSISIASVSVFPAQYFQGLIML